MKKLLIIALAMFGVATSSEALVVSTNILATAARSPAFILLPSRASVYQVILAGSSGGAATVIFYDSDVLTTPYFGTNYTNGSYLEVLSYATNQVGTFVGYNGITNYTTNTGIYTYTNFVKGNTNVLPQMGAFAVGANNSVAYNADMLFAHGISVTADTNVTVTILYKTGQ